MSWVKWLKGKPEDKPAATGAHSGAGNRRARRGGEAYSNEWVKVLEETAPDRDPNGTYTWELHPEADRPKAPAGIASGQPKSKSKPKEPFDTFTWELQENESAEDPWGLQQQETQAQAKKDADGVNPYDTGVFQRGWGTGRFDRR